MKTESQSRLLTRAVSGADALVRGGPLGPPVRLQLKADGGVGRGPGGPPHRSLIYLVLAGIGAVAANAATPTFNKDVLPILQKHCQECHRPGEMAPMSLLGYTEARPWA